MFDDASHEMWARRRRSGHAAHRPSMKLSEFYELVELGHQAVPEAERESVAYARADLLRTAAEKSGGPRPVGRAANWCAMGGRLLDVATSMGRVPRGADDVDRKLLHWISYQRRSAARLNGFQISFLEQVPGWSWAPWDDGWDVRAQELCAFVRGHGREPRTRSSNAHERALAKWFARQRQLAARGQLPYHRARTLRDIRQRPHALEP